MYNLYRAWFGEQSYPHLETLSPPDTVVRVGNEGEHQFVAHRGVLAAHSGYLKALLSTTTSGPGGSFRDGPSNVTSISVSSVGGEAFAPLLNYMYTGRLEVTLDNIYSVLLATHLLHMPGALEQCRGALLRLRGPPPPPPSPIPTTSSPLRSTTTILRPVPNRLVGPPLCWPQAELYSSSSVGLTHLPNLHLPSNIPVIPPPTLVHETITSTSTQRHGFAISPPLSTYHHQKTRKKSPRSTSPVTDTSKAIINNNCSVDLKKNDHEQSIKSKESPQCSPTNGQESRNNLESLGQQNCGRNSRLSNDHESTSSNSGVIFDVACCDGPVKFQRVLNENYTSTSSESHQQRLKPCTIVEDPEILVENDENGRPDDKSEIDVNVESSSGGSSGSYKCSYCQHTFKSHYCYKKHARRHLLPTDNELNTQVEGKRREVRQLDLNVQYYPCKICGSKFPSYYFVHKHKKMCHPNADERNFEGENSQFLETASTSKT